MWKKLLSILGLMAVLIVASIGGQIGRDVGKTVFSSKPSQQEVEAKLTEGFATAVNELNQKLPMMLDEDTRLDKATVGPGARAVYHHSLPKYTSSDIDANRLRSSLRSEIMQKVCNSNDMKKSLQFGGIYVYAYSGNDGIEISRFEIDGKDCGLPRIYP